jgi:hypothetical protein
MRTLISLILILQFIPQVSHSQSVGVVEVSGSLKVGDSESDTPSPETIKWSRTDFLGWDGSNWVSLTKSAAFDEVTLPLADDVQIDDFIYPIYFDASTYRWKKACTLNSQ